MAVLILLPGCGKDSSISNPGSNRFSAEDTVFFSLDASTQSEFNIEGISGKIEITGISGSDSIVVTAVKRVWSETVSDAEDHLQFIDVNVHSLVNEINVRTVQPADTYNRNYQVEYEISLPSDMMIMVDQTSGLVAVETHGGRIAIMNISGTVSLNDINGNVYVNQISGVIIGDITLPPNGTIDMVNTAGTINLTVPQSSSADFTASVTSGSIDISDLILQDGEFSPNYVHGILGGGDGTISLTVTSGLIIVDGS
jgi:hypothetical protein